MDMIEAPSRRMAELLESLLEQTRSGAIAWRQTDLPHTFLYAGQSGAVLVTAGYDEIGHLHEVAPSVSVLNSAGDRVETFDPAFNAVPPVLEQLVREIRERWFEGSPLLDTLRREIDTLAASA
jgi:hypothetical protein